jgi:hypothetical protein
MNPPPPPPHGEQPKGSGLPPGKYDIFIIPPHSSGSGFLYLPSLKPNVNSFAAGFASALILVVIGSALAPAVQAWWNSVKGSGGMGMLMLIVAIGVGAWALGRIQSDGGPGPGGGGGGGDQSYSSGPQTNGHAGGHAGPPPNGYAGGPAPGAGPQPQPSTPGNGSAGGPKPSWQRAQPPPGATGASANANTSSSSAKGAWERAREETKRKEEERKKAEAEKKRREDLEKRLKEAREKEAREREAREKKQKEEEAKRKEEAEARERKRKEEEAKRKEEAEAREKKRKEEEAKKKLEAESQSQPRGSTYAYSMVGEKTNPWPRGRPPSPATPRSTPPSPTKKPPAPTAKSYLGTEDDGYSYRPYDKPKPMHKKAPSSIYSESSYAASHTTAQTTPPPSHRGAYSTKDPDKIVIKAVYAFNNAFMKTPTSQLVSGVGSVTDGLILRITTEGLFIDDDVRGVPQREWDVKAWTMKLVEVWCPSFRQGSAGASASARVASNGSPLKGGARRLWGLDKDKPASPEETEALLSDMLQICKNDCRLRAASSASSSYSSSSASTRSSVVSDSAYGGSSVGSSSSSRNNLRTDKHGVSFQTGELKTARLHVLRASIRDQEGKKYVFVITEEESWKVAVGLQRLRKGTQVRALGVSGMSAGDARSTLENLGWG